MFVFVIALINIIKQLSMSFQLKIEEDLFRCEYLQGNTAEEDIFNCINNY